MTFFESGTLLAPLASSDKQAGDCIDFPYSDFFVAQHEESGPAGCVELVSKKMDLQILGVPDQGARSRTETQIRFVLRLVGEACPYRYMQLPEHQFHGTGSKRPKLDALGYPNDKTLYLRARVVRSDDAVDGSCQILACYACILREKRRAVRKRTADDVEVAISQLRHSEEDRERIILFAGPSSLLKILDGDVMVPCRITCYCRHHDERTGFRVAFQLWDWQNRLVCSAISPPIMITDDHKRMTAPFTDNPRILKIVPAEGPMHGGIEVTLLGQNLSQDLSVRFGSAPATILMLLNSTTLIVRLPPALAPGFVAVSVDGCSDPLPQLFNYKNDLDRAMMELALQLIGMKLTGRVDDARDVALRIIQENAVSTLSSLNAVPHQSSSDYIERSLITGLTATEMQTGVDFSAKDFIAFRTSGGQTLLHLAALRRLDRLFEYLASFGGVLVNAPDSNDFTASDLAYLLEMDETLLKIGLDEAIYDVSIDSSQRYSVVVRAVQERKEKALAGWMVSLFRHPPRMRGQLIRLRTFFWRRFFPAQAVKPYYYNHHYSSSKQIYGWSLLLRSLTAGYRQNVFLERRARDFLLWYFWVPILTTVILMAYPSVFSKIATLL